jgi:hypothetical protein
MPKPSLVSVHTAPTFEQVLADAKPITKSTRICLRGDLIGEVESLHDELSTTRPDDNRFEQIATRIEKLTDEVRTHEVEFTFRSMGRRAWHQLVAEHPPTTEQRALGADFNTMTMPVIAMATSCIAPAGATLQTFEDLDEQLTDGQWNQIWAACHAANTNSGNVAYSALALRLAAAQRSA